MGQGQHRSTTGTVPLTLTSIDELAGFRRRPFSHYHLRAKRWRCCCAGNADVAKGIWAIFSSDHGEHPYAVYAVCICCRRRESTDKTAATYNVYLTLEQEIEAQTNTILNATACNNGTADSQVACLRALGTEDLARANGLANNVVIDGKYITQPYIYWNGTVRMQSINELHSHV